MQWQLAPFTNSGSCWKRGSEMSDLILPERTDLVEALGKIHDAVNTLNSMSGGVELIVKQLNDIIESSHDMSHQIYQRDELLERANNLLDKWQGAYTAMERQRDATLDELSTLINRLKKGDFFSDELGGEIYEAAVEEHNQAFWESLPYDMATAMGGKWGQLQADLLHSLIIGDAEEVAEGNNLDIEDVVAFRDLLFDIVDKLYQKGSD